MAWNCGKTAAVAVLVAGFGPIIAAPPAFAADVSPFQAILDNLKASKPLPPDLKSFDDRTTSPLPSRSDADIRKQKKDAADSLDKTLREIDDRTRTKAIEDGRAVLVQ